MSEESPKKEASVCNECCNECCEAGETETEESEVKKLESEESEPSALENSEGENQEKITVTNSMDVQGDHFLYSQATEKSIQTLDYDYKRCNGCGICVEICPTKALELGPVHEIATGLDAPAVMMDL